MSVGRVNGVELYWEQRGGGPRLLFCNGSGLTLQDIRPLLDPLTASFDLLAWDYRGFGVHVGRWRWRVLIPAAKAAGAAARATGGGGAEGGGQPLGPAVS